MAMNTVSKRVIENGDMSGSLTSEPFSMHNLWHVSFHSIWTGAPTGTLFLEISSEVVGDASLITSWETLSSVAIAGADTQLWLDRNAPYVWARLRYVFTAGAGNMNSYIVAKGDL